MHKSMIHEDDTICAVSTSTGQAAIGIIRVSGPESIRICDSIFHGRRRLSDMESFTAAFGHIKDRAEQLDEVIALVMKGPHTYTTEDTVELDCHGGPLVMQKIIKLLIRHGARPAEPGEFTKRAYLGGRIDMTRAEAVMDVINAENDMALTASMNQLSGVLRDRVTALREKLLTETAFIEAALDDPEHYSLEGYAEELGEKVDNLITATDRLINTGSDGRIVREGIRTVIAGRPNVGKSSVMNMLTGTDRAIVTEIEGTTRDTLEECINLGGIMLKLIDTAGIRSTTDKVEQIGVTRAREALDTADLILLVIDSAEELTAEDERVICSAADKKLIVLLNKSDLPSKVDKEYITEFIAAQSGDEGSIPPIIYTSAARNEGIDEIRDCISKMFLSGKVTFNNQLIITNSRHTAALYSAKESLQNVRHSIDEGMSEDLLTIDLLAAYEDLGRIIGETLEDDLADKIFKDFCMGK